ncbi:MAG: hypothetical protein NC121_12780 [Blautia sp.]|nr:hypothetical protein [Blautia sp.]
MENLTNGQVADLLLTKAMADSVGSTGRWDSLNAVIDEVFENGAVDRDGYLHSIMELTQLGFVNSDLREEGDIEMSEAAGYDIAGLTSAGEKYIGQYLEQDMGQDTRQSIEQWEPTVKEKFIARFNTVSEICGKISENGMVKLISTIILPIILH